MARLMLIVKAFPFMQVYTRPKRGNLTYNEHVITLPNNVQNIASILPRLFSELPLVISVAKGQNSKDLFLKARGVFVWKSLL